MEALEEGIEEFNMALAALKREAGGDSLDSFMDKSDDPKVKAQLNLTLAYALNSLFYSNLSVNFIARSD